MKFDLCPYVQQSPEAPLEIARNSPLDFWLALARGSVYIRVMSMTEILEELPKLNADERHTLFTKLNELESAIVDETPEMLAAIDEGIRSLEQSGGIPMEVVKSRFEDKWHSA